MSAELSNSAPRSACHTQTVINCTDVHARQLHGTGRLQWAPGAARSKGGDQGDERSRGRSLNHRPPPTTDDHKRHSPTTVAPQSCHIMPHNVTVPPSPKQGLRSLPSLPHEIKFVPLPPVLVSLTTTSCILSCTAVMRSMAWSQIPDGVHDGQR